MIGGSRSATFFCFLAHDLASRACLRSLRRRDVARVERRVPDAGERPPAPAADAVHDGEPRHAVEGERDPSHHREQQQRRAEEAQPAARLRDHSMADDAARGLSADAARRKCRVASPQLLASASSEAATRTAIVRAAVRVLAVPAYREQRQPAISQHDREQEGRRRRTGRTARPRATRRPARSGWRRARLRR